jgi:glutamate-1-semialdehyde 2,1-aminomutase
VAVAAGLTQLRLCTPEVYAHLDRTAAAIAAEVSAALAEAGVAHRVSSAGNLFSVFFTDATVVDYATARTQDVRRYAAFFHAMLDRGVYLPPSAFEAWFVGAAHGDEVVERVAAAARPAARAAAEVDA